MKDIIIYNPKQFFIEWVYGMPHWGTAKECYQDLWEIINGRESWQANPWVWVVSFKVLSAVGKPEFTKEALAL